jgi:hypothetical protein
MSTPNPLVPEGSLQQSKGKSNVKIAVLTIAGIHAVLLVGFGFLCCDASTARPNANESSRYDSDSSHQHDGIRRSGPWDKSFGVNIRGYHIHGFARPNLVCH